MKFSPLVQDLGLFGGIAKHSVAPRYQVVGLSSWTVLNLELSAL